MYMYTYISENLSSCQPCILILFLPANDKFFLLLKRINSSSKLSGQKRLHFKLYMGIGGGSIQPAVEDEGKSGAVGGGDGGGAVAIG